MYRRYMKVRKSSMTSMKQGFRVRRGVKRKSQTTNMNPQEKPKARRRNPEGGNGRTPRVLSSRHEPAQEILRQRELSDHTEGWCQRYPGTSADTLELARDEIMELRKGLKSTLHQLDLYEANGEYKSPYVFPEVNGILNHVMEPFHTHHPKHDATFLEWGRNTDLKNLTQEGTASCDEEATNIGTLV